VLTPNETEEIFGLLRRLAGDGRSIVFISHKLYEVLEVADRITIIRRGRVIGERRPSETTEEELAELMVGREVELTVDRGESHVAGPVLVVEGLRVADDRHTRSYPAPRLKSGPERFWAWPEWPATGRMNWSRH